MIQRRAVVGISLLSALLFCALAAQSASAAKAVNTTAVTCVKVSGTGDFNDEHCDSPNAEKKGNFTHEAVPLNETKKVDATNQKVTNGTKDHEPVLLRGKIGLTKLEVSCTKFETDTSNSFVHNVETESKKHTMTGNGTAVISECTVLQPAKCTIKQPIRPEATFFGVEGLGAGANEMGVEFVGSKAEETFAEITLEGAECASKGKTFKVKGSVIGTSGPTTESSQTNKYSGATIVFTPKKEMEKLKVGVESAEVEVIVTPTGTGGGAHPIPITTTT
jgi:hypothetical protein